MLQFKGRNGEQCGVGLHTPALCDRLLQRNASTAMLPTYRRCRSLRRCRGSRQWQLLAAADAWARAQHYEWLTLGVFGENTRAVQLYEQAGFKKDIVRLLKPLR